MNAATIIRTLRERRGLSRDQLARLMGVSYHHIWTWEKGNSCPTTGNFVKFIKAVDYEIVIKPKYKEDANA